jgi:hypothetical protein
VGLLVWIMLAGLCWFLGCLLLPCVGIFIAASVLYVCTSEPLTLTLPNFGPLVVELVMHVLALLLLCLSC